MSEENGRMLALQFFAQTTSQPRESVHHTQAPKILVGVASADRREAGELVQQFPAEIRPALPSGVSRASMGPRAALAAT